MHDEDAASPHREYDRVMARDRRWAARWSAIWTVLSSALGAILALIFAVLLVVSIIDLTKPVVWGTFTQTDCEPTRRWCRPIGFWVSEDRSLVEARTYLDGWTDHDGTVRAAYRPSASWGDDVVHTALFVNAGPLITGVVLVGWVGYVFGRAFGPRRIMLIGRRRRAHPMRLDGRIHASPRRRYRASLTLSPDGGGDAGRKPTQSPRSGGD